MSEELEIRCPVGPKRLFLKMISDGNFPQIGAGNLIEASCSDCKRLFRDRYGISCSRVLHRYNLSGELISSMLVDVAISPGR